MSIAVTFLAEISSWFKKKPLVVLRWCFALWFLLSPTPYTPNLYEKVLQYLIINFKFLKSKTCIFVLKTDHIIFKCNGFYLGDFLLCLLMILKNAMTMPSLCTLTVAFLFYRGADGHMKNLPCRRCVSWSICSINSHQ